MTLSEEHRRKISESKLGKKMSEETKRRMSISSRGKLHTEETKAKIRAAQIGRTTSLEVREKLRVAKTGKPNYKNRGENNGQWKGNNVGYISLHEWVRKHLPEPALCQICEEVPPYDLANISGMYLRDITDWRYLCRKCHMKDDKRIYNLRQYQGVVVR